jgi:hypothetical protein
MTNGRPDAVIARVAAHNRGPFTHRDARRAGLSQEQIEHRCGAGHWQRLLPAVYAHAATRVTPDVRHRAALLWAGPDTVLSHRSAGEYWRLDGVRAPKPEVTVHGARHPRSPAVMRYASGSTKSVAPAGAARQGSSGC